jgi:hypothetical protein
MGHPQLEEFKSFCAPLIDLPMSRLEFERTIERDVEPLKLEAMGAGHI